MQRIFGFDIGTTSIGWAVIDHDASSTKGRIVEEGGVPGLGVRIFPEARDTDGTPLNQQRRQKRMARRQLRRRRTRRRLLNETLAEAGLLPPFSKDKESKWAEVMALDPYPLRVKGLAEPLSPHEFGRAIYHLSKRRHFRGRDLEDEDFLDEQARETKRAKKTMADGGEKPKGADDEEKLKEQIKATHKLLEERKITLGQFLAEKQADARKGAPPAEKRREIHAHRSDVDAEFERLWTAQAHHHPGLADVGYKERVKDAIFAQRPVFWRKSTLGECPLSPGAPLCPKGSWLSQQRRMIEQLNNLAIAGGNARPLDEEERSAILAKLQTQGSMSWAGVRKILKPILRKKGQAEDPKFNLEMSEGGTLLGNPLEAKLADIFGDHWGEHPHKQAIRDAVHERLWNADYGEIGKQRVVIRSSRERKERRATAARSFIDDFGVTKEQAAKLRDLKLPTGWEPFSTEALRKILAELKKGEKFGALVNAANDDNVMRTREGSDRTTYGQWRDANFPNRRRPTGAFVDLLPSPKLKEEQDRIKSIRNPTVVRTQNELRKVVNNLIRVYGKPDLIRIELARDLGKSKREREEDLKRHRKNEKERKKAADDLASKGIANPSRMDIKKWVLWQECGEIDPYSGSTIDFDALFRTGEFDIEHIWPESTSFDSSLGNLTLCSKSLNIKKGKRTPFDAFGADENAWAAMKDRIWKCVKAKTMPAGKAKRFCREEPLPEDFASRQLIDTGYAARQARAFLMRLWPDEGPTAPVRVQPVSGKVTAQLRRLWELNNILSNDGEKTRADHRHHAVDALAVACAHPGVTQKLSCYLQEKDAPGREKAKIEKPWATIRGDAERAVAKIVVSHRVRKKVSGPLHKETVYGDTGEDVKSGSINYRQMVQRAPINSLDREDIDAADISKSKFMIRDDGAAAAIRAQIERHGGDLKKALALPVPVGATAPSSMKRVRLVLKRRIDGMQEAHNGFVDPESKHHMAFYDDGTASPVTLFEAFQRKARKEPVVRRAGPSGARLLMTLCKGDCLSVNDPRAPYWIVRELKANGQITLVPHIEARPTKQAINFMPTAGGLTKLTPKKYNIDPIGRVRPARD